MANDFPPIPDIPPIPPIEPIPDIPAIPDANEQAQIDKETFNAKRNEILDRFFATLITRDECAGALDALYGVRL